MRIVWIIALGLGMMGVGLGQASPPPLNQFQEIEGLNRARHIARTMGERINGGIERYRTEPAMHRGGIGENHVENHGSYWLISFLGGTPEEVSIHKKYSIYTIIKIDKTTFRPEVVYNGEIPESIKVKRGLK